MDEAFNMNREEILSMNGIVIPNTRPEMKHNALQDAMVIKAIYEYIHK